MKRIALLCLGLAALGAPLAMFGANQPATANAPRKNLTFEFTDAELTQMKELKERINVLAAAYRKSPSDDALRNLQVQVFSAYDGSLECMRAAANRVTNTEDRARLEKTIQFYIDRRMQNVNAQCQKLTRGIKTPEQKAEEARKKAEAKKKADAKKRAEAAKKAAAAKKKAEEEAKKKAAEGN